MSGQGIDEAAGTFAEAINPAPVGRASKRTESVGESLFENSRESEGGVAGGDIEPDDVDEGMEDIDDEEDEDEPDAGEDDEDGEDTSEDDEEDEEEDDEPEAAKLKGKVKVKVDGEEKEVSLREAVDGYIRTETFHRRLNQLKEVATTVEQEATKVAENRSKYEGLLNTLTEQLDLLAPQEPNWDELSRTDPQAAFRTKLQWDKYKEQRAALDTEKERLAEEKKSEATESLRKYAMTERGKMLEAVPEWSDPKTRTRDQEAMTKTAKKLGFSDDEISTVYDSRMMQVLLKAAKYDRLMARKPAQAVSHSKLTKQGAGASRTAPRADVGAQKRLAKTGTVEAAADVFGNILAAEKRASRKTRNG